MTTEEQATVKMDGWRLRVVRDEFLKTVGHSFLRETADGNLLCIDHLNRWRYMVRYEGVNEYFTCADIDRCFENADEVATVKHGGWKIQADKTTESASPEMYEALEAVWNCCDAQGRIIIPGNGTTAQKVKAALAKARGGL